MIHDWRAKTASPSLPFYFVQLAPCYGHKDCGNFVDVRNAQMAAMLLPNVSYATAADLGDRTSPYVSVHPRRKQELCRRLALQALKMQYGMTTVVASGPEFESVAVAGSALTIKYKAGTAGTLHPAETADSPGGCAISPFEVSISAGKWLRANFSIGPAAADETVMLKMPSGITALASTGVRYAWTTAPTCMVYNGAGAPGTGPNGTQPAATPGATGIAGTPFCWTGTAACPVTSSADSADSHPLKTDDTTARTEPPTTDSGYSCGVGAGLAGGDLLQAAGLTLAEAEEWCASNSSCAAFTFEHNSSGCSQLQTTAGSRTSIAKVFFKTGQTANTDANWRYFAKTNFTPNFSPKPSYRGCDLGQAGSVLPWCNRTKSHAARVELLLGQLTLTEKIGLLSPTPSLGNPCNTHTVGAPRLGLSDYMWLEEANTGVSSACLGPGHCATTFAGPLGLGASFNRSSWYAKGSVLGNEMRAMNNIGWFRDAGGTTTEKLGLTGYGPNINQPRDPR